MKESFAKGFYAVGLLLLTFQVLVHLFDLIVNEADVVNFTMHDWTGMAGYVLLMVLFAKRKLGADFILTLIGALLWVVQFVRVFTAFSPEIMSAFLYCAVGILGVILVLTGLTVDTIKLMKNKN